MKEKIRVPNLAKEEAKNALRYNLSVSQSKKVGLSKAEASKIGINSGIERAKQLINNKFISNEDAKAVARFYQRFKNCKTKRCEMAISLWGGRKFGRDMVNRFYR